MTDTENILIAGNGVPIWKKLKEGLSDSGFDVKDVSDGDAALRELEKDKFRIVLLNSELPGVGAEEVLKAAKEKNPFIEVIVFAEDGRMKSAFDFMRLGAYDYLTRPIDVGKVIQMARKAVEDAAKAQDKHSARHRQLFHHGLSCKIAGESPAMRSVIDLVHKVAPTDATVLIQGETGVGKELIANTLYQNSSRSAGAFTIVNCSAIPENLLESELFGYEKGAFTGASRSRKGLLETADRGTLFLDEIGETSRNLQSKLLRVVETGTFHRLGSDREQKIDVRIISATNKDLEAASSEFRRDLYYRLSVMTIHVPPLRERLEDIPFLADFFLRSLRLPRRKRSILSSDAVAVLQGYPWPGNVRELRNVMEQLTILVEKDVIEIADLPPAIRKQSGVKQHPFLSGDEFLTIKEMEKMYIEKVLWHCDGHRTRAAGILGVTRATLYNKLKRFGVDAKIAE